MKNWIANLRAKPEAVRRRLAFTYAVATTSVIAMVWLVNLGVEFSTIGKNVAAVPTGPSPVEMMMSSISENVGRIKSGASQVGAAIKTIDTTLSNQATTTN